jgi:glycerophosphoryl diester phosphodiesterase
MTSHVFGHRGAKAYAPMNTLPAFHLAADQGAYGIELDVWLSADGVPVILHDEHVDGTTDGTGSIREMTLARIQALDAGSYFGAQFAGTRIPTLEQVFAEAAPRFACINVEIKAPGDADPAASDGVEQAVARLIAQYRLQDRVIVSSFSGRVLGWFHALMPAVPIGYLFMTFDALEHPIVSHCDYLHPYHEMIYLDSPVLSAGLPLNTWTVNSPDRARALAALGVHAIITDAPDVILAALAD